MTENIDKKSMAVQGSSASATSSSFSNYVEALGPLTSALLCFPMCIAH